MDSTIKLQIVTDETGSIVGIRDDRGVIPIDDLKSRVAEATDRLSDAIREAYAKGLMNGDSDFLPLNT